MFNAHIVPIRLFDDVSRSYFHPSHDQPDCQPRTEWGLHNAFTRAMRDLTPLRQFGATQGLGRAFGLSASEEPVLDVTGRGRRRPDRAGRERVTLRGAPTTGAPPYLFSCTATPHESTAARTKGPSPSGCYAA